MRLACGLSSVGASASPRSSPDSQRAEGERLAFHPGSKEGEAFSRAAYGAACVIAIAVPVIVNVAVRTAPVLAATVNWTVASPAPDAPWVTVRNAVLLTAVHAQLAGVLTVIDAEPPAAENVVVVTPVMTWHPPGDVVEEPLPPQAMAIRSNASEPATRIQRETDRGCFMNTL